MLCYHMQEQWISSFVITSSYSLVSSFCINISFRARAHTHAHKAEHRALCCHNCVQVAHALHINDHTALRAFIRISWMLFYFTYTKTDGKITFMTVSWRTKWYVLSRNTQSCVFGWANYYLRYIIRSACNGTISHSNILTQGTACYFIQHKA